MTKKLHSDISTILLAGGKSSRMETDKRTILLDGESMVSKILGYISEFSDEIIISTNDPLPEFKEYTTIHDSNLHGGPLEGIVSSIPMVKSSRALIVSCDMPLITTKVLIYLIQRAECNSISMLSEKGTVQPIPMIIPGSFFTDIKRHLRNGFRSVHSLLDAFPSNSIPIPLKTFDNCFINVNTRCDFEKLKNYFSSVTVNS